MEVMATMFHNTFVLAFCAVLSLACVSSHAQQKLAIDFDQGDPMVAFAAEDLYQSVRQAGYTVDSSSADFHIKFDLFRLGPGTAVVPDPPRG